jgi:hypothetical protein
MILPEKYPIIIAGGLLSGTMRVFAVICRQEMLK